MKKIFSLVFAFLLFCTFSSRIHAQVSRGIGGGSLILSDSLGNQISIETPQPGDPGYDAWVAGGGKSVWKLPIPPFPNANAGFVLPGDTDGQLLVWVAPPNGGPQGAWEPMNVADFSFGKGGGGGGGNVSGTGADSEFAVWVNNSTIGTSSLSENGSTLTFSGSDINTGSDYQIGGSTVLQNPGTQNTFVGVGAGFEGSLGSLGTAIGDNAKFGESGGYNRTALGANAYCEQDNALVLGSISGVNGAETSTSVGIGTTTPYDALDVEGPGDLVYLYSTGGGEGGPALDINGDSWTVNNSGQIAAGGYNSAFNASLTMDNNSHLATIGFGTQIGTSDESITVSQGQQGCGSPTDVAGLVDFSVVEDNEGSYVQVSFSNSYSGNETVTLTPANALAAQNLSSFYVNVPDGSGFEITETGEPATGEYKFYYHVIDIGCPPLKTSSIHTSPR